MKVNLTIKNNAVKKTHHLIIKQFIGFLQKKIPLQKDIEIVILNEKISTMSTGGRFDNGVILVLGGKRIIRDILRTIAHEWVHEYQMSILGRKRGPNIGGKNEDEANAFAGRLVKMFELEDPSSEKTLYE